MTRDGWTDQGGPLSPKMEAAIRAAMEQYVAEHGPLHIVRHSVQVTSYGGSGTTALLDRLATLGIDLPRTPGGYPFKHQREPSSRSEVPAEFRVVYTHADPRDAMLSIFRRHYGAGHYAALRGHEPGAETRSRLASVEAFVEGGVDEFMLADHVDRWMRPQGYPVLFVRYESIERAWPRLLEFLNLPRSTPALDWKPRRSDWRTLPLRLRDGLDAMYGSLAERLRELPDVLPV